MDDTAGTETVSSTDTAGEPADDDARLLDEELLVEEISIDGMCGVY